MDIVSYGKLIVGQEGIKGKVELLQEHMELTSILDFLMALKLAKKWRYLVLELFSRTLCVKKHYFCGLLKKNCKIICSSEFNFCTNFPVKNGKTSY